MACLAPGTPPVVYRKANLFGAAERSAFVEGGELVVADVGGHRLGLLICFDVEFPETARALAAAGAKLLVTIAANMEPYGPDHALAARARALDNRRPHVYVNRTGRSRVCGSSATAAPSTPAAGSSAALGRIPSCGASTLTSHRRPQMKLITFAWSGAAGERSVSRALRGPRAHYARDEMSAPRNPTLLPRERLSWPLGVAVMVIGLALATGGIEALRHAAPVVSLSVVYLVPILIVSAYWGIVLGLATSVLGALSFNFFFLDPTGRFTIADSRNWAALLAFLGVALVTSTLAESIRARADEAEQRRREARPRR